MRFISDESACFMLLLRLNTLNGERCEGESNDKINVSKVVVRTERNVIKLIP